jgi:hypothetical protein
VFSALGKFSDAVSDYLANIDHAPDPSVKKEAFSSEISIAYDVLANTWIHTREPKVLSFKCLRNLRYVRESFMLALLCVLPET